MEALPNVLLSQGSIITIITTEERSVNVPAAQGSQEPDEPRGLGGGRRRGARDAGAPPGTHPPIALSPTMC